MIKHPARPKTVLITGVSSGIGRALALEFIQHGCRVIGVCRSNPGIDLDLWIQADITDEDGRKRIAEEAGSKFGSLDILINNAGKGAYATWEELPDSELKSLFELDFFAPVALTKRLLPMLKQSGGIIVNISSAAGRIWIPCMGSYCAAKAAFAMFSNSLRVEMKQSGVRVIDVAPGQISTGFSSRAFGSRRPPNAPARKKNGPAGLAHVIYRACVRGRSRRMTYPSWIGLPIAFARGLFPAIYDRINRRLWKI